MMHLEDSYLITEFKERTFNSTIEENEKAKVEMLILICQQPSKHYIMPIFS